MNKDYGEIICSAVDSIIQSRLSNLEFNVTKTCTIIDISSRNQGKYIVSDGSAKFEVYSEDTSYNLDDNVLVLIPNGDYKNNKIILGKTKIEKELPYKYTSPMTTMVKFTENILYDGNYEEKTFNSNAMSLLANENEEDSQNTGIVKQIYGLKVNGSLNGYSRLGLSADFKSLLRKYDVQSGTYGLYIEIISNEVEASGEKEVTHKNVLTFSAEDMAGNPYGFDAFFTQEKVFDISHISNIQDINIYFYQNANFLNREGNLISPYLENGIGLQKLPDNLFVDNIKVYFGYSVTEFKEETLILYSDDVPSYHYKKEDNTKELKLRWIHKIDDYTYVPLEGGNKLDSTKYELRWYQYDATCREFDSYAGPNWKRLEVTDGELNSFIYKFTPNVKKLKEQIKVVGIINDNNVISSYASNIFTLDNEEYVPEGIIYDVASGLSIKCNDGSAGNYFLYDQNGKIQNHGFGQGYLRTLVPVWNGEIITKDTFAGQNFDYVEWLIPFDEDHTMIRCLETTLSDDNTRTVEDIEYYICKIENPSQIESDNFSHAIGIDYEIKNLWTHSHANNTVVCTISVNGVEYSAVETLRFGRNGSNGTNYTLVLDFEAGKNALTLEDRSVIVRAHLYDSVGNRVDFTSDQAENIQWSWYKKNGSKNLMSYQDNGDDKASKKIVLNKDIKSVPEENYYVLQISYKSDILATELTAFLPISIKEENYSHIEGATEIIYDHMGKPKYSSDPYRIFTRNDKKEYEQVKDVLWNIYPNKDDPFYPKLKANNPAMVAPQFYIKNQGDYACVSAKLNGKFVWSQPILIMQSQYDFAMLNSWDENLTIDEDSGTILSTMLGAGKKVNNKYSGVLIGDIQGGTGLNDTERLTGVYGFQEGIISYGLREDGTAFFGKSGGGRIHIDGTQGTITSGNYVSASDITTPEDTRKPSGMKINLEDGHIDAYNFKLSSKEIQLNSSPKNSEDYVYIGNSNNHLKFGLDEKGKAKFSVITPNFKVKPTGDVYFQTGYIGSDEAGSGGWVINKDSIYTKNAGIGAKNSFHMYSSGSDNSDPRSGVVAEHNSNSWRLTIGPNFGVISDGRVYSQGGRFKDLRAISGKIGCDANGSGGWDITTNSISNGAFGSANNIGLLAAPDAASRMFYVGSHFYVTSDGSMYCTNGYIGGAKIGEDFIQDGIGGTGWRIDKDGNCYFNNGTFKGHIEASSGSFKGHIEASSGTFKGHIEASSGHIGCWHIYEKFISTNQTGGWESGTNYMSLGSNNGINTFAISGTGRINLSRGANIYIYDGGDIKFDDSAWSLRDELNYIKNLIISEDDVKAQVESLVANQMSQYATKTWVQGKIDALLT